MTRVRQLAFTLYDESAEVQDAAVNVFGKNLALNPFNLQPVLLKKLLQLMNEVRHQSEGPKKRQGLRALHTIVVSAQALVKPHVKPILAALTPMLDDPDAASGVLDVLSALGAVDQNAIQSSLNELFKVFLQARRSLCV